MREIEELVDKAKNGDKAAFSELIDSVYIELYRFAKVRLGNDEDAQDAVQEAVINAYLHLNKLKDNTKFKSWITTILVNECNRIYKKKRMKKEVSEEYIKSNQSEEYLEDNIDFETMMEFLNEKETEIFKLHYRDGMTTKQISRALDINENTIKTTLKRGKEKIRKSYKPTTIFVFILCVLITTSVIAVSIISYIKSLFEVNSVGIENTGVQMAIENLEWYQETNMDYIDLGDGYKISLSYIVLDEMNLYMVFDLESEEDISKYTDISLANLKIVNESNNVIYDLSNLLNEQYAIKAGDKLIKNSKNHMQFLYYIYADSMPKSKSLNISFSNMKLVSRTLLNKENILEVPASTEFEIKLDDKFVNRKYISYNSDSDIIEKAIVSETGFYAIILSDNSDFEKKEIKLIDEKENIYKCYVDVLTYDNSLDNLKYIVTAKFNDNQSENVKLIIDKNEYVIIKN